MLYKRNLNGYLTNYHLLLSSNEKSTRINFVAHCVKLFLSWKSVHWTGMRSPCFLWDSYSDSGTKNLDENAVLCPSFLYIHQISPINRAKHQCAMTVCTECLVFILLPPKMAILWLRPLVFI